MHTNAEHKVTAAELYRHRRGLRVLIVVLIPLGIWTLVGLVVLWPGNVADHVNADAAAYSAAGVSYPHAQITAVEEITCDGLPGSTPGQSGNACANLTATVSDGEGKGDVASVPLTHALYASGAKVGQSVVLIRVPPGDGQPGSYQFSDFDRRTPLIVLSVVFALVVVAVARWRGLASLLGLAFAGFILVKFMFPALVAGQNPVVVGLIGSSAIMFVVLYAAHGFNARTTTALVGTLFGLVLIATLGYLATSWAHLTGVASEDDYILAASTPDLQLTSVVICGIIVAGLGVLNDVTITQASAVWELADGHYLDENGTALGLRNRDLFARAMRIGRDHIASTVYTIAFATAGASLSVLLLIAVYNRPLLQVLQTEQFSAEIVRTLVGSIGLVLAVPLTTAIGVAVVRAGGVQPTGPGTGARTGVVASPRSRLTLWQRRDRTPPAVADPLATFPGGASGSDTDTDSETRVLAAARPADSVAAARSATGGGAAAPGADKVADVVADAAARLAKRRRRADGNDFGDFSDLRDPDDTTPRRSP